MPFSRCPHYGNKVFRMALSLASLRPRAAPSHYSPFIAGQTPPDLTRPLVPVVSAWTAPRRVGRDEATYPAVPIRRKTAPVTLTASPRQRDPSWLLLVAMIFLGPLGTHSPLAAQSFDELPEYRRGIDARMHHDDAAARRLFEAAAQKGDPDSMFALANNYVAGRGVPHNERLAQRWNQRGIRLLEERASRGDFDAALRLSSRLGAMGPFQDKARAKQWLMKAEALVRARAKKGDPEAVFALGKLFEYGRRVPKDPANALALYRQAATTSNPALLIRIAQQLHFLNVDDNDVALARERLALLEKAASLGSTAGKCALAEALEYTFLPLEPDPGKAFPLLKEAADAGDIRAFGPLATSYASGYGTKKNGYIALRWYEAAAKNDDVDALVDLADYLGSGELGREDLPAAFRYYSRAAYLGSPMGHLHLGDCYHGGLGTQKDDAAAVREYEIAAGDADYLKFLPSKPLPRIENTLGVMYFFGWGVTANKETGLSWYRRAAEHGDTSAMLNLAIELLCGTSSLSPDEGIDWLKKAAKAGNISAYDRLGRAYEEGRGVPQNFNEALRHYWWGIERGDSAAAEDAGDIYVAGRGIPKQLKLAYICYNLAAAAWPKEDILRKRDRAAAGLTASELASAQEAVRRFDEQRRAENTNEPESVDEGKKTRRSSPPKPLVYGGSGVIVARENGRQILTNQHVIAGCRSISVNGRSARVLATGEDVDLGLLDVQEGFGQIAVIRDSPRVLLGEPVLVAGFPLPGLLTGDLGVSSGAVSAVLGPRNEPTLFQMTAPVQPGNSGGPILDEAGHLMGLVVGTLNASTSTAHDQVAPQNVNFAIQLFVIRRFLDANEIRYSVSSGPQRLPTTEVAEKARSFMVSVTCERDE